MLPHVCISTVYCNVLLLRCHNEHHILWFFFTGFTTSNSTWLPVNPNYENLNVAAQIMAQTSHLKVYRELAVLRKEEVFLKGNVSFPVITEDIFSFMRYSIKVVWLSYLIHVICKTEFMM